MAWIEALKSSLSEVRALSSLTGRECFNGSFSQAKKQLSTIDVLRPRLNTVAVTKYWLDLNQLDDGCSVFSAQTIERNQFAD